MKLLVSVKSVSEAVEVVRGGTHVIDVGNPMEGSPVAHFSRVARRVEEVVPGKTEVVHGKGSLNHH